MKAYPLPACNGTSCNQGRAACKTEALCTTALHRIPLSSHDVTDREFEEEMAIYGKGAIWFALALVAFSVGFALALPDRVWPQLVAWLS